MFPEYLSSHLHLFQDHGVSVAFDIVTTGSCDSLEMWSCWTLSDRVYAHDRLWHSNPWRCRSERSAFFHTWDSFVISRSHLLLIRVITWKELNIRRRNLMYICFSVDYKDFVLLYEISVFLMSSSLSMSSISCPCFHHWKYGALLHMFLRIIHVSDLFDIWSFWSNTDVTTFLVIQFASDVRFFFSFFFIISEYFSMVIHRFNITHGNGDKMTYDHYVSFQCSEKHI